MGCAVLKAALLSDDLVPCCMYQLPSLAWSVEIQEAG